MTWAKEVGLHPLMSLRPKGWKALVTIGNQCSQAVRNPLLFSLLALVHTTLLMVVAHMPGRRQQYDYVKEQFKFSSPNETTPINKDQFAHKTTPQDGQEGSCSSSSWHVPLIQFSHFYHAPRMRAQRGTV